MTRNPAQVSSRGVPSPTTPTARTSTARVDAAMPAPIMVRGWKRETSLALATDTTIWAAAVEAKK